MHRTTFLLACLFALTACTSTSPAPQTTPSGDAGGPDATSSPDASGGAEDAGADAAQPDAPSGACPVAYCEQYCANLGQVFDDCVFEDTPLCTCMPAGDASTDAGDGGGDD